MLIPHSHPLHHNYAKFDTLWQITTPPDTFAPIFARENTFRPKSQHRMSLSITKRSRYTKAHVETGLFHLRLTITVVHRRRRRRRYQLRRRLSYRVPPGTTTSSSAATRKVKVTESCPAKILEWQHPL
uniref:(northern house mosquito) hypothetical protein n=1 Tax=Culex pipiens TaxID=7175 RepID=A0A8D8BFH5_CULPI